MMFEQAEDAAGKAIDATGDAMDEGADAVEDAIDDAGEAIEDAVDDVRGANLLVHPRPVDFGV